MKDFSAIAKKSKLYQDVEPLVDILTTGQVLVIDPSIGSSSSFPGWAMYIGGELRDANIIDTGGSHLPLWKRARSLGSQLQFLSDKYFPDLLIYEDIPATSGFNQNAIASLLKAVGIVLACTESEDCLGIHPASWKNYVRPTYTKGDKEDAIEIGYVAIGLARHIKATRKTESVGGKLPRRSNRSRR